MGQTRIIYAVLAVAASEFVMGLWAGWPSWALVRRPAADTPAEWLSRADCSWAVAIFDLANLASAWPAAALVERAGRKCSLVATAAAMAASFAALSVPGRWPVFAARAVAGACKSIGYAAVPSLLAEISADRTRGRLAVAVAAADSLGMLVAMVAGPRAPYGVMNAASAASAIAVLAVLAACVAESPRYLLAKGRADAARRAHRWYRPADGAAETDARLADMAATVRVDMDEPSTCRALFEDDGNRAALLLVAGACLAQRAGGVGCVAAYSTGTLPPDGPVRPENVAAVFAAVRLAFTVAAAPLVDGFGRRPLLVVTHMCLAAVMAAYAVTLSGVVPGAADGWAPAACVVLFTVAYSMGPGVVPAALLGEMFPANVKSHAVSVVAVVAALGSFVANKAYLPVADAAGVHVMFAAFCVVNATWAVCAYLFLFETNGMSLSAIQDVLDDYNSSSSDDDDDDAAAKKSSPPLP